MKILSVKENITEEEEVNAVFCKYPLSLKKKLLIALRKFEEEHKRLPGENNSIDLSITEELKWM
jgi:hypothetical protein